MKYIFTELIFYTKLFLVLQILLLIFICLGQVLVAAWEFLVAARGV